MDIKSFQDHINAGYTSKGPSILLGGAMLKGECLADCLVKVPLKTMNRHGLIAGATGTGKTKTLQVLAEQLSLAGVPVLMMDLKGDLSGLAQAGEPKEFIIERHKKIGVPYEAMPMPVELLSLSSQPGVKLRSTVTEFGPVLLGRIMDLNDIQSGVLSMVFKYCDDKDLPLLDLKDLTKMLQFFIGEGKAELDGIYGAVSSASVNTIIRKIMELEQQGADLFFGEPSFDPADLLRTDSSGKGYISIIRLTDIQDRPKMFSTFMLSLLAEIYSTFPEQGDAEKPKLVIFVDEAHLVFDQASKALTDQIEAIVKLIRSKGVGIFFCTQSPTDIPDAVLGQLGLKIQHALRAFTAKDRKAIKLAAENYPDSDYYKTDEVITALGIGEAFVTALNEKGIPTPLAATYMRAPMTRMDILSPDEINQLISRSRMVPFYDKTLDRESAYELINTKIQHARTEEIQSQNQRSVQAAMRPSRSNTRPEPSLIESLTKNTMVRQVGRTVARELARGLLGVMGVSATTRRRR